MPIFTFRCSKCSKGTEVICSNADKASKEVACDHCGRVAVYDATPELIQRRDFSKSSYKTQVVLENGRTVDAINTNSSKKPTT